MMSLKTAVEQAERLLPGVPAPEGEVDERWQAIIAVAEFIPSEPDAVWRFVHKWGCSPVEDVRMAVATCLLEHLLEHHFERFFSQVEVAANANRHFADTVSRCWVFVRSELGPNAARFERFEKLRQACQRAS